MDYVTSLQELLALKPSDALPEALLQSLTRSLNTLPASLIRQLVQILLTATFARNAQYDLFKALVTGFSARWLAEASFYPSKATHRTRALLDTVFAVAENQSNLTAASIACAAVTSLELCKDQPSVRPAHRTVFGQRAVQIWSGSKEDTELLAWMAAQSFAPLPAKVIQGPHLQVRLG